MKLPLSRHRIRLVTCAALLAGIGLPVASPAASGDPDLNGAPVQALRAEYVGKRDALAKQQAAELSRIVADGLEQARQMQAKAKISGNVTAQAAASAAVRIYTEAGAALTQSGKLLLPGSVRQDLETFVEGSRKAQRACDERHTAALRALEGEYAPRLAKLVAATANAPDTEEEQLALLGKLAGTPAVGTVDSTATNTVLADAVLIRASGEAKQWETLFRGEIRAVALEIVPIAVTGLTAPKQTQSEGDESRQPYTVQLTPVREFTATDPAPAFRVMSLPPLAPVDVVAWPTAANGWSMDLRVRPARDGISRHGFVLEVDAAARASRLLPGQTAPADPTPVAALRKPADATPAATPRPVVAATPTLIRVAASAPGWVRTGLQVRKGARVQATVTGTWSCGQGGEAVDAEGYPNGDRFFRYYLDPQRNPRITQEANYGALIARVLPDGPMHALGKQASFAAEKAGEVVLAINEDPDSRRDNKGTMEVRLTVAP